MVTNGATLNKQEVSWEEALGGPLPDTSHQQRLQQTAATVAATMDAAPYNTPPDKLQKAMDLVLTGKVQAHEDGLYSVQGSTKTYDIGGECPCPQGQLKRSNGASTWWPASCGNGSRCVCIPTTAATATPGLTLPCRTPT